MYNLEQTLSDPPKFDEITRGELKATLKMFFIKESKRILEERYQASYVSRWIAPDWAERWIRMIETDLLNTVGVVVMMEDPERIK